MKTKKTTILTVILVSILLSGCLGSTPDNNDITLLKTNYQTKNFSIYIPKEWEVIEKSKFTTNIPQNIVVIFRNNIKNEIFTANASISVNILTDEVSSIDLAKSTIAKAKNILQNFRINEQEEMDIPINGNLIKGFYISYEGKKTSPDPIIAFKQLFIVNNEISYIITGAHLTNEDKSVVNQMDDLVKSFSLK